MIPFRARSVSRLHIQQWVYWPLLIARFAVLDGFDVQVFNLSWLRQQISLVGQEPILFSTSIFENIRQGLGQGLVDASNHTSEEQLQEIVVRAAKNANAHDFIIDLPRGYQNRGG